MKLLIICKYTLWKRQPLELLLELKYGYLKLIVSSMPLSPPALTNGQAGQKCFSHGVEVSVSWIMINSAFLPLMLSENGEEKFINHPFSASFNE